MAAFFAITFLIILAAISPGPDFVLVTKNALQYSRKSGVFTALGVSCSLLIHASYCLLGLGIIISKSLLLFSIIKYIGATYLIYIGIKSLLAKRDAHTLNAKHLTTSITAWQAFRQGLLCNLLNPKAIMFLLAFFTVILNPSMPLTQQIAFGIEIALIHFIWFSLLAILITHRKIKTGLNKIQYYFVKVMGVALIAFGARIATLHYR
jgi:RhtB (resistance to homoserine/threonine) family protein